MGVLGSLILLRNSSMIPRNEIIIGLSKTTFGIYLLHPIFLSGFRQIGIDGVLLPIAAFITSLIMIYLAMKFIPKQVAKYVI